MTVQTSTIRAVLSAVLCMIATGCVIPTNYYTSDSRKNVTETTAELIVTGKTTKEDVLLSLGEPDEVSHDENTFTYSWTKVKAIWAVGGTHGGAAGGTIGRHYNLVIDFDNNGVVSACEFLKGSLTQIGPL